MVKNCGNFSQGNMGYSYSHLRSFPPIPKLESHSHCHGIPIPTGNPIPMVNSTPDHLTAVNDCLMIPLFYNHATDGQKNGIKCCCTLHICALVIHDNKLNHINKAKMYYILMYCTSNLSKQSH